MSDVFKNRVFLWVLLTLTAPPIMAQNYCETGSSSNQFMWIESIESGSFINATGPFNNDYGDQDHLFIGYDDETDQTIEWQVGSNPIRLVPGRFDHPVMDNYPSHWQVWIDLNQDGQFGTKELVYAGNSVTTIEDVVDLSVHNFIDPVTTRMRISSGFYPDAPACGSIVYGEVEDYTVRIHPAVPFSLLVPEQYSTIQAAIDAANPGERVLVNDGIYPEQLLVDKPLFLESVNGSALTAITGAMNHPAITVQSSEVIITGFDLSGERAPDVAGVLFDQGAHDGRLIDMSCGENPAGLLQDLNVHINHADRIMVDGLICQSRGRYGILIENSDGSVLINNDLSGHTAGGIRLNQVSNSKVMNNRLNDNGYNGLVVIQSAQIDVISNECSRNFTNGTPADSAARGIIVFDTHDILLHDNQCMDNFGLGMEVVLGEDVLVTQNTLSGNRSHGLRISESNVMTVSDNVVANNQRSGAIIEAYTLSYGQDLLFENNLISGSSHYGLQLEDLRLGVIRNNQFFDNNGSINLESVQNSVISGNSFDPLALSSITCKFNLDSSVNNAIYFNSFNFFYSSFYRKICGVSLSNAWQSPGPIDYIYDGEVYAGTLGNYFAWGDHTDADNDGISDVPFMFPDNGPIDDRSMAAERMAFELY